MLSYGWNSELGKRIVKNACDCVKVNTNYLAEQMNQYVKMSAMREENEKGNGIFLVELFQM